MCIKVLIVGNGAREHVIAESLKNSQYKPDIYAVISARNPGIVKISEKVKIGDITNPKFIMDFAKKIDIDFAVIGPEAPLESGVVDSLENIGIPCVGPKKDAARIETDKSFNRWIMEKYKTDGRVMHKVFDNVKDVQDFIDEFGKPVAVKPLGLTGGKGVKIVDPFIDGQLKDLNEAKKYAKMVIENGLGGYNKVIIEEKLEGEEFTFQVFVDGKTVIGTPLVQDHKFAFEGDKGPFTGGMGSYSDSNHLLPFIEKGEYEKSFEIVKQVFNALKKEGIEYKGILYGGFILTKDGPKILEFNARFGDPEAMNILPILETDFIDVCLSIIEGKLSTMKIKFRPLATVCKYIAPKGYPNNPIKNVKIEIGDIPSNIKMYFASLDLRPDGLFMKGSRAVAFVGIDETIEKAEKKVRPALKRLKGPIFFRNDIGTTHLLQKRVKHMKMLKGVC